VRSGEARGARWDEIDLAKRLWTVPEERTKSERVFKVPLAGPALRLLASQPREDGCPYVFIGEPGRRLGRLAMLRCLQRLRPGMTVHGLRSTFADWSAEKTYAGYEAREGALAHVVGSGVERAYRRGDLLEQRRKLAEDWAAFLTAEPSENVVPLRRDGGAL